MKTTATSNLSVCLLLIATIVLAGCMKDNIKGKRIYTYTISTPVFESLSKFRENIKAGAASDITSAGKIAISGQYIFISTPGQGIHVIDNSEPAAPKNISFINIPGNADLAIAGNTLYADAYSDLITFDIQNPANPKTKNFATNVFPSYGGYYIQDSASKTYSYYYSAMMGPVSEKSLYVIKGWTIKDTTIEYEYDHEPSPPVVYFGCANCSYALANAAISSSGGSKGVTTNGSLSRFAISNNYLYAIGYDSLSAFDITDRFSPALKGKTYVNWASETVFPFKDKLFVGTTNGMFMYDVQSTPDKPSLLGQVSHIRSCDPVIADDNYAYVTLRDGTQCSGFVNQLDVYDINNLNSPSLLKTYALTHPTGLSKDGDLLFICDGKDGLKVFDATDKNNLKLIKQLKDAETIDVIAYDGLAIVMTVNGIYQYSYSDLNDIHLLSKL
jgi:hypothetical protein